MNAVRCRINLATQEVTREVLFNSQNAEHPQVNPRWYSRPTRHLYISMSNHPDGGQASMPPQVTPAVSAAWCSPVAHVTPAPSAMTCFTATQRGLCLYLV